MYVSFIFFLFFSRSLFLLFGQLYATRIHPITICKVCIDIKIFLWEQKKHLTHFFNHPKLNKLLGKFLITIYVLMQGVKDGNKKGKDEEEENKKRKIARLHKFTDCHNKVSISRV